MAEPHTEDAPQKRPKMSLGEQNLFLLALLERCKMLTGDQRGAYAGVATLALSRDDMLRIEAVQQTLAFFELHRADAMLRAKLARDRGWTRS